MSKKINIYPKKVPADIDTAHQDATEIDSLHINHLLSQLDTAEQKTILDALDELIFLLSAHEPVSPKQLEDLKTHALQAKSSISDGILNNVKKWASATYNRDATAVDKRFNTFLEHVGAYQKENETKQILSDQSIDEEYAFLHKQ